MQHRIDRRAMLSAGSVAALPRRRRILAGVAMLLLAVSGTPAAAQAPVCAGQEPADTLCRNLRDPAADCGENCCSFAPTDTRAALVIGNNDYSGNLLGLCNAANDAHSLATELKAQQFSNVCCLLNARSDHINGAIASSKAHLDKIDRSVPKLSSFNTRFLMYFAGHGAHVKPAKAEDPPKETVIYASGKYSTQRDLDDNHVSINVVREDWGHYKSVAPVIVVDACRGEAKLPDTFTQHASAIARAPRFAMASATRSTPPPPPRRERSAGYVVLYSTKAGAAAQDVSATQPGGQSSQGRFMRYFSQEIKAFGRNLDEVFEAVKAQVQREASGALPPDGQTPDKKTEGDLFTQAKWRVRGESECANSMNRIGQVINEDDDGNGRCSGRTYAECLSSGPASPKQCDLRELEMRGVSDTCRRRIDTEFEAFFGTNGSSCGAADIDPVVAARNFRPGSDLAVARVNNAVANAERTAVPFDVAVQDRVQLRVPQGRIPRLSPAARMPASDSPLGLPVDCVSPGAGCTDRVLAVRQENGELEKVSRNAVRVLSAARKTVKVGWDTRNDAPDEGSLDALERAARLFQDLPEATIRITAEIASGAKYDASLAQAERRRGDLVLFLKGAGLRKQRILNEIVMLAEGQVSSTIHVEFIDPVAR